MRVYKSITALKSYGKPIKVEDEYGIEVKGNIIANQNDAVGVKAKVLPPHKLPFFYPEEEKTFYVSKIHFRIIDKGDKLIILKKKTF